MGKNQKPQPSPGRLLSVYVRAFSVWPSTREGVCFCPLVRDFASAPSPTDRGLASAPDDAYWEKDPFRGRVLETHHGSATEVQDLQERGGLRGGEEECLVLVRPWAGGSLLPLVEEK